MIILDLVKKVKVKSIANITGGGLTENIPRSIPNTLSSEIYLSNWKSQDKWSVSLYADNVKILYQPLEKGEIIEGSKKIQISPEKSDIEFKPGVYKQTKFFVENVVLGKDTNISFQNLEEHKKTVQLIEEIFCRK